MNSNYPLISVIIPVWNGEKYLPEALRSIYAQQYPSLEIIVIDDGSIDNTATIAQANKNIMYLYQDHQGPSAAKNLGLRNANGNFIAFLDCDDLWIQNSLSQHLNYLIENPSVNIIQSKVQDFYFDSELKKICPITQPYFMFPFMGSSLFRKLVFDSVGLFEASLNFSEDWDWALRAYESNIKKEKLNFLSLLIRKHENNMTKNASISQLNLMKVYHRHIKRMRQKGNSILASNRDTAFDYFGCWPY